MSDAYLKFFALPNDGTAADSSLHATGNAVYRTETIMDNANPAWRC